MQPANNASYCVHASCAMHEIIKIDDRISTCVLSQQLFLKRLAPMHCWTLHGKGNGTIAGYATHFVKSICIHIHNRDANDLIEPCCGERTCMSILCRLQCSFDVSGWSSSVHTSTRTKKSWSSHSHMLSSSITLMYVWPATCVQLARGIVLSIFKAVSVESSSRSVYHGMYSWLYK